MQRKKNAVIIKGEGGLPVPLSLNQEGLLELLTGYFILINLLCFFCFFLDKQYAIRKRRRIAEKTLLTLCILGGAFGGFLAMRVFRHKTRVPAFKLVYVTLGFWAIAAAYALFTVLR